MKQKKLVTIFTPTYNRAYTLERLYNSLVNQNDNDFEWIVIDDGSTDNTAEVINNMKNESKIQITYEKKENEGKHVAINRGLEIANGELFFIVDSDDYLTQDAIQKIRKNYQGIKGDNSFIGIVGLRGKNDKEVWNWDGKKEGKKDFLGLDFIDATSIEYRFKYGIKGDRAEVFKTSMLKKYSFPKFNGENFILEGVVWNKIAHDGYKFRYFNDIIYITEYLEDGLTKNMKKKLLKNIHGTIYKINQDLKYKEIPLKIRIRNVINYCRYGMYAKIKVKKLFKDCNFKVFFPIAFITAILIPIKE